MKHILLTFDDGPNPPYTSKILDILKKHKVKAIFFLLGHNVKFHTNTAERIKKEGHTIGNHSFSHKDLRKLSKVDIERQITKTERIFSKVFKWGQGSNKICPQQYLKLFRAPYGFYNKKVKDVVRNKGYKMLNWTVCAQDWENPEAKIIADRVISKAKDKGIILLHDGSNIRQRKSRRQTALALEIIIKKLKNKKFVFDRAI